MSPTRLLKVLFIIKDTDSLKIQLKYEFLTTAEALYNPSTTCCRVFVCASYLAKIIK